MAELHIVAIIGLRRVGWLCLHGGGGGGGGTCKVLADAKQPASKQREMGSAFT